MVTIFNEWIVVTKDDPSYFPLSTNLYFSEKVNRKIYRKTKDGRDYSYNREIFSEERLYEIQNGMMFIPRGLFDLIKGYFYKSKIVDKQYCTELSDTWKKIDSIYDYKNILNGIELRDSQLIALNKMFALRRGIVQMGTGAGKSEIICAFCKVMEKLNGYIPTTLIIEPTIVLVNGMVNRLSKYGIKASSYSDTRSIERNSVMVCHPASLGNDIKEDNELLSGVSILLFDETHHTRSVTYSNPMKYGSRVEFCIGMSASAISEEHINSKEIKEFYTSELRVIGCTGKLMLNVSPKVLIKSEVLSNPSLIVLKNPANEYIPSDQLGNWHKIVSERLNSDYRNRLIVSAAKFFSDKGRKVMILLNTIKWSRMLLEIMDECGIGDITRASYGGGRFEMIEDGKFKSMPYDTMNSFASGDVKILIGTTHLYEGVDVPNLDVIIMAYAGKAERTQIQGVGRALRITKTGKYAYIIDFTDDGDNILSYQSRIRMKRYRNLIGIEDDKIYYGVSINDLPKIFDQLEMN